MRHSDTQCISFWHVTLRYRKMSHLEPKNAKLAASRMYTSIDWYDGYMLALSYEDSAFFDLNGISFETVVRDIKN